MEHSTHLIHSSFLPLPLIILTHCGQRVNAAAREQDMSYSQLIHGLDQATAFCLMRALACELLDARRALNHRPLQANIVLNRKMLMELAIHEPLSFQVCRARVG